MISVEALRVSPQQVDPLSWFTRPLVPVAYATMTVLYGLATLLVERGLIAHPLWDLVAVAVMGSASLYVQVRSRPFRGRLGTGAVAVTIAVSMLALAISTWANWESTVGVQFWWAPVGVGIVVATLAPFSSVLRIALYGSVAVALTAVAGAIAFLDPASVWPPLSTAVVAASTVMVGVVASAVFSYMVVSRTQSLLAGSGIADRAGEHAHEEAISRVERETVARLGARVAPFLDRLADAGVVTDADRALAGQLARRLRSDLVEQASRTWLDKVAERGRIFVVDPERRAERMNSAQRSALRGLLVAALRTPGTDVGSLFIELRPQDDGSTAVALSLDIDLPEGRRAMMLAPYYLALQMTVTDMKYDAARELLRFELRD